jgi:hypothetical protein
MKVETWVYRHVHEPLRTGVPFRIRIVALWFASGTTALGKVMGQHRVHVHTRFKVEFYPASTMVALSALRRVRPYRWRPLSPTTASCSLPESLAEAASWQQAQALMTVTQHGGTSSRAPMAANGMPYATGIGRATVVHVGTILVVVKPTWVGYTYSDRERPRDLMSCSSVSGVKCECRVVL